MRKSSSQSKNHICLWSLKCLQYGHIMYLCLIQTTFLIWHPLSSGKGAFSSQLNCFSYYTYGIKVIWQCFYFNDITPTMKHFIFLILTPTLPSISRSDWNLSKYVSCTFIKDQSALMCHFFPWNKNELSPLKYPIFKPHTMFEILIDGASTWQ